jgi:pyrimidine-specific ribonucleoside hydrolase
MSKIPIIMDSDPGHDDALAIMLALSSDKLDVKGICAVSGNQTLPKTLDNCKRILEILGRIDVPVVKGYSKPLLRKLKVANDCHGETGLDGPQMPIPTIKEVELPAAEFIAKLVSESDEPITLVPTGPLTNIATFLLAYPELKKKIKMISLMGGMAFGGNRSANAEFNIWQDPEAGAVIFNSGIPIYMFGLDVTHKAIIYKNEFEWFRNDGNRIAKWAAELWDFHGIFYMEKRGFPGCPVHDACAVAYLIDPTLFTMIEANVKVDCTEGYSEGCTCVDIRHNCTEPKNVQVAFDIDRNRFLQLLMDACHTYA